MERERAQSDDAEETVSERVTCPIGKTAGRKNTKNPEKDERDVGRRVPELRYVWRKGVVVLTRKETKSPVSVMGVAFDR